MNSSYSFTKEILTLVLSPLDVSVKNVGIELLKIIRKNNKNKIIFDMSLFDVVTSLDIKFIEGLVSMLKLNNIFVVVCNFNPQSASILFHFIDEVKFETTLDVQSAIDVFQNK